MGTIRHIVRAGNGWNPTPLESSSPSCLAVVKDFHQPWFSGVLRFAVCGLAWSLGRFPEKSTLLL